MNETDLLCTGISMLADAEHDLDDTMTVAMTQKEAVLATIGLTFVMRILPFVAQPTYELSEKMLEVGQAQGFFPVVEVEG